MMWLGILCAIVVLLVVTWPIRLHNRLVSMQTVVTESWRGVDIELARRWDLIPQLVSVAKAFAKHEAQLLERLVALRSDAPHDSVAEETQRESELGDALSAVRIVAEQYPKLQSSKQYARVMSAISDTEDRIAAARRLYNGNVSRYNAALRSFPTSAMARRTGMEPADFFELDEPARKSELPELGL